MLGPKRGALGLAGLAVAGVLAACGGGGGGGKVSASSLDSRLIPPSLLPSYQRQRTFDWSDPVNLVGEGFRLPEATHPSAAVKVLDKEGLKGATGQRLTQGRPPTEGQATNGVLKLGSAGGATRVRDFLHRQDLQQPCFSACIYSPKDLPVPGVPSAVGVQQIPNVPPPPGGGKVAPGQGPPVHYFVEFTVGPYLYFGNADGSRSDARRVVALTQRYYQRVKKLGGS
jgi:hypothetical protein